MTLPEPMFDQGRLRAKRGRAQRIAARTGRGDAGFLIEHAALEMAERLRVTNRPFRHGADFLTATGALAGALAAAMPGLEIARLVDAGRLVSSPPGPGSLDLAVSAFGLHWDNDLPGTLAGIRAALRPDGLFMAVLPGEGTLAELRDSLIAAEASLSPGASMRVDPFADIRQAGALLQGAGFALPVADIEKLVVRYDNVAALVADLRAMGATSSLAGNRTPLPRGIADRLEAIYAERHSDPDGRIRASFNLIHLTGWAPHESQQKPLRPGSGRVSLARHLGSRK